MDDALNPYASPAESEDGSPVLTSLSTPYSAMPYASAQTRARWTVAIFWVILVGSLVSAGSSWLQIQLLQRAKVGSVTEEEIARNDNREMLIGLFLVIMSIGLIVAFLMWFHRAHRNLPSLGAKKLRFTPAWAVGYWFIPVLNLFRPYQVMREIWSGSDPAAVPNQGGFLRRPAGSAIIGWWWAFFLIMGWTGQISFRLAMRADSIEAITATTWLDLADCLVTVLAAWLAIVVVRRTTSNQEERHRLLTGGNAESPRPAAAIG